MQDGFFFIDQQKFFLKGIGYEIGATPGQLPWNRQPDPDLLRADMQRIVDGGFNSIRTWNYFTNEELTVIGEFDIKIIMGIWIDPHGDFSSQQFVIEAHQIVQNVLAYSKNHDNIIAYLIMNEPVSEVIFDAGYKETLALLEGLIDRIHEQHPGVPVSIANSPNGTYIDQHIFDFSAFNAYIYAPSTINHSHEYQAYTAYLKSLVDPGKPIIISEYGLSVSQAGPGNWGYGGNTLIEQEEGILHMYRGLLDGGASGSFIFNYSDGWWKGGNEYEHDNHVEEWFGLVEYQNLQDKYGTPRPAWYAARTYQKGIITSPKNGTVYHGRIPIELFTEDPVYSFSIHSNNDKILEAQIENYYFTDTLEITIINPLDVLLEFKFYDQFEVLIKDESISILLAPESFKLPVISISIEPGNYWAAGNIRATYQITHNPFFAIDGNFYNVFYPHIGFEYGSPFTQLIQGNPIDYVSTQNYYINNQVNILTLAGGFDIYYGDFKKRIYNQVTLERNPLTSVQNPTNIYPVVKVIPNPSSSMITISGEFWDTNSQILYQVFTAEGSPIMSGILSDQSDQIDISRFSQGIYFLTCHNSRSENHTLKFIKL
jgi:hypothetical protein